MRAGSTQRGRSTGTNLIYVGEFVSETFTCEVCGQMFSTQAALRAHNYKMHFDDERKQDRQQEVQQHKVQPTTSHAKQGLPWCRHCNRKFSSLPALQYHINSQSCQAYRVSHQSADETQPDQNIPLIKHDEVFTLAQGTWQDAANSRRIRNSLHHCPECHLWCAQPQYVRRHMQRKHPHLMPVVRQIEDNIRSSNIGLQNPCQFCGQRYQSRPQHLNACTCVFLAHYLHHRLHLVQDHGRGRAGEAGIGGPGPS